MRIQKIRFRNYKILEDNEFIFSNGLNFINERNEFGKSTIIEGIVDAFSLSPRSLAYKTTEGKEIPPVIQITLAIGENSYELKVNAQEERVHLRGNDGTELESPQGIKNFLAQKGYFQFPYVLEGLLVLKERDLSIGVTRGLKEIFNAVLRSASVKNLESRIRTDFILQRAGLRQKPFGHYQTRVEQELSLLEEKISFLLREKEEFEKDKQILKNINDGIEKLTKEQEEVAKKYEQLKYMLAYLELQALEREKVSLKKELDTLKRREKELEQKILTLEERLTVLKEEREKLSQEISNLFTLQGKIETKRQELKLLKNGLKLFQEIKKLEDSLGAFAGFDPDSLEDKWRDWKTFLQLKERTKGVIKILAAKDQVLINENPVDETEIVFQGGVRLRYRDLLLDIFADTKVADLTELVQELAKEFGSPERLLNIIKALQNLRNLYARAKEYESHQKLLSNYQKLDKEIKELESLTKNIELKRKEHQKLDQEKAILESRVKNLNKSLLDIKAKVRAYEEKLLQLEEKIKNYPRDFEEKLSLKTLRNYEKADLKSISEEFSRIDKDLENIKEKLKSLAIEKARYEEKVKRKPDLSRFNELLAQKAELEQKILRLNRMEKVLRFSADILSRLNEELNRENLRDFEEKVAEYFSLITGGRYQAVYFKGNTLFFDKDSFAKDWEVSDTSGKRFDIESLSDGTKAQLLLAARLALARKFLTQEAFFLFDEPFAYFDSDRRKRTISILESLAVAGWQVIVMSAHG